MSGAEKRETVAEPIPGGAIVVREERGECWIEFAGREYRQLIVSPDELPALDRAIGKFLGRIGPQTSGASGPHIEAPESVPTDQELIRKYGPSSQRLQRYADAFGIDGRELNAREPDYASRCRLMSSRLMILAIMARNFEAAR